MTPRPPKQRSSGLAHSVGAFFGHIVRGVRTDPAKADNAKSPPAQRASRTKTETARAQNEEGDTILLRRTTIEEIEVRPKGDAPPAAPHPDPDPDPSETR